MLNSIWIELHQEMPRHPKALALAQALKVSRREAVGILIDLWTWGLSCADEDGGLKSIGDEGIALALDWPIKKAAPLVRAFVQCGWLDDLGNGIYRLHDWPDYTSKLSEKRKDAERKRRERMCGQSGEKPSKRSDASVTCPQYVRGQSADSPTLTTRAGITEPVPVPNQNKLSVKNTPSASTAEDAAPVGGGAEEKVNPAPPKRDESPQQKRFAEFWGHYPRRVGKGAAEKAWEKLQPNEALFRRILSVVDRQKQCDQWQREDGRYIPYPATWLNQERWEDEPELPDPPGEPPPPPGNLPELPPDLARAKQQHDEAMKRFATGEGSWEDLVPE